MKEKIAKFIFNKTINWLFSSNGKFKVAVRKSVAEKLREDERFKKEKFIVEFEKENPDFELLWELISC